jgi:glycosyltransferase involved in cell wall biosynthesis
MATAIKRVYDGPVCCTLQGEDLFLQGLPEPYRSRSLLLIRQHARSVDGFVAVSVGYADEMAAFLGIPREKIRIVPLGVELAAFRRAPRRSSPWTLGYMARIAPEKGLHVLVDAWRRFRKIDAGPARLEAAGYLAPEFHGYLDEARRQLREAGLENEFVYRGELDQPGKIDYLASLDAFCVPAAYDDPKGIYMLEAMATGLPVVAPARGAAREYAELAGGAVMVAPDDPQALAEAFARLKNDAAFAGELAAQGPEGALRHFSLQAEAEKTVAVYQSMLHPVTA